MLRALAVLCGILIGLVGLYTLVEASAAGFPDGHLSDFDRAMAPIAVVLGWVGVIAGVIFSVIALINPQRLRI